MIVPGSASAGLLSAGSPTLKAAITALGLTTNLRVCLDAGDALSYSSGQKWLDRSGNGYDFFRGADGTATTDDPTFNGFPGGLSRGERWAFDGGDFFRYDTTIETWMSAIHKDGTNHTIFAILSPDSTRGSAAGICGTASTTAATPDGFYFVVTAAGALQFFVTNLGATVLSKTTDSGMALSKWHAVALDINENGGSGSGFLWLDGAYLPVSSANTWDAAYSSPSSSDGAFTLEIGATGNATTKLLSGDKLAAIAIWQGTNLGKTRLDQLHALMRGRFGI